MSSVEIETSLPTSETATPPPEDVFAPEQAAASPVENTQQKTIRELETAIGAYAQKKAQEGAPETIAIGQGHEAPSEPENPPVYVANVSEHEYKKGLRQSVQSSLRWLAEQTKKMIKKFKGRFVYKES
ncbi:hypothetical protein FWH30_00655 [Microgenomates group bacterium]|nr:hypothetical protein [Microgenomates group bacterium]